MSQTQKLTDKQVGTYLVYRMKLNELIHLHFLFRHLQSGGCGGAIHGVDPQIVLNTIRTSALAWFIVEFSFFYCPALTKVRLEPTSEEYRLEFAWLANLVTLGYVNLQTGTIHNNEKDAEVDGNPYGSGEDERILPSSSSRLWTD